MAASCGHLCFGGNRCESNTPKTLLTPHAGFEDRREHQNPSTPMNDTIIIVLGEYVKYKIIFALYKRRQEDNLSKIITDELRYKLLILFTLNEIKVLISKKDLENIILDAEILDFFNTSILIDELIESELIISKKKDNTEMLSISDEGMLSVNAFFSKINNYHKKLTLAAINRFNQKREKEKHILASYTKISENSTILNLNLKDEDFDLINININMPSNEAAEKFCKIWEKDAISMFQKILRLFESHDLA